MGLFDSKLKRENRALKEEIRQMDTETALKGGTALGSGSIKGVSVTRENVMQIPAVQSCINYIANDISSLPIYLYQEVNGTMEKQNGDKRIRLLNDEPDGADGLTDGRALKRLLIEDMLLEGQAFIKPEYDTKMVSNRPKYELKELNHLPASHMVILNKYHNGYKYTGAEYQLTTFAGQHVGKQKNKTFKHDELLRIVYTPINSIESIGLLTTGGKVFAEALAVAEHNINFYNNGAMPLGVLTADRRLSTPALDRLRDAWESIYSGVKNRFKTMILEEGLEYKAIAPDPEKLQMNETIKTINAKICQLFNVPESMIMSAANKYNSVAQNNVHFKRHTLKPVIDAIENALNRQLLTEKEKDLGYCFRFDTRELLRTTDEELTSSLVERLKNGLITINEARFEIDKSKVTGGDKLKGSLADVLHDIETGKMEVPNMDGGTEQQKQNTENEVVANE